MGFLRRLIGGGADAAKGIRGATEPGPPTGIFAGLFGATADDFERWDLTNDPLTPPDWPAMEFKHLNTVQLGTLEAILTEGRYDAIDQDQLHRLLRAGSEEDGPWIVQVRDDLVNALVELSDRDVASVARSWANTEEFTLSRARPATEQEVDELRELLLEMAQLARVSRSSGRDMYLLMSL